MKNIIKQQPGFITLLGVLIVSVIAVAITLSLLFSGSTSTKTSLVFNYSTRARSAADACADEALRKIRKTTAYTGSGSATLGLDSCAYTVTSQGGEARTITSTGTSGTVIRKVQIIISAINPKIVISSWFEVADF